MNDHNYKSRASDAGFTLVEILVTISIMVILTAVLIPNIRTVTKDRNSREAGRIIGSILSQASQRAVNDGVAGIVLFRNPNYLIDADGDGTLNPDLDLQFAVDRIALLRKVPEYTGDTTGAIATLSPTVPAPSPPAAPTVIARIPLPIEQTDLRLIAPGDTLSLNNNRYVYPITLVSRVLGPPAFLDITIDVSEYPDPTALLTLGTQFVVNRSPRVLKSSEVTLPADYIIDLRFSGFDSTDSVLPGSSPLIPANVPGFNSTVFELAPAIPNSTLTSVVSFVNQPIALLFNEDGAISQMGVNTTVSEDRGNGLEQVDYAYITRAQGRLFLFVTEYDADSISTGTPSNPLLNDTNLWVSASSTNGTVNVGTNSTSDNPAGLSLTELGARYQGTSLADRSTFNGFITNARSDSVSASAAQ